MSLQGRICKLQKEAKVLLIRGKISHYIQKLMELEQARAQTKQGILFPKQAMN
jgi:hypothetical protein